jgi:TRAP-type C4-dicarboxylate transport system permease small subunit
MRGGAESWPCRVAHGTGLVPALSRPARALIPLNPAANGASMEFLDTLNTRLNRIVCGLLTAIFSVMVVVVFAQVIFRYSLEQPLSWSEEVARYMFIWATFLGASVAFYENTHINVTYFTDHIPNVRARALVMILADLASMTFLGMYVYEGFVVSNRVFTLGQFSPSMEWLPIGLVYLAIPIGSLLMILNILAYTLRHLHALRSGEATLQTAAHH